MLFKEWRSLEIKRSSWLWLRVGAQVFRIHTKIAHRYSRCSPMLPRCHEQIKCEQSWPYSSPCVQLLSIHSYYCSFCYQGSAVVHVCMVVHVCLNESIYLWRFGTGSDWHLCGWKPSPALPVHRSEATSVQLKTCTAKVVSWYARLDFHSHMALLLT